MVKHRARLLALLLLTSSVGCVNSSGGDPGLPPVPTEQQEREMRTVEGLRDGAGKRLFPELYVWHGEVADYFCAVFVARGFERDEACKKPDE